MIREAIRDAMDRQGISQAELARRADTSRAHLVRYLAGTRELTTATLERLCDALSLTLAPRPAAARASGRKQ